MMKEKFLLPKHTLQEQEDASNPKNSAWVSANAGSGKTHVLSKRVIRLLLRGVDPAKILCLTYTRQAAANMSNRILQELAKWVTLSETALQEELQQIEGIEPDSARMQKARQLFASALESGGSFKIQTIHAFCESVLHRFPIETNIPVHFELLDSAMEKVLMNLARRDLVLGAMNQKDPFLQEAFSLVLSKGGETGLNGVLKEILLKAENIRILIHKIRSLSEDPEKPFAAFLKEFGFSDHVDAQKIASSAWPIPEFSEEYCKTFCEHAESIQARFILKNFVPFLKKAFEESDPCKKIHYMAQAFLTSDGHLYHERSLKGFSDKGMPDFLERYKKVACFIQDVTEKIALFEMLQNTIAVFTIADFLIDHYEYLKTKNGFLDFNDLITRTVSLFARQDVGAWVRYRLDERIDHILLDEAQDTSPGQWNVIRALGAEFFIGDRALRTVFAVGDEKQSIYSFQGAIPGSFSKIGDEFFQLAKETKRIFKRVNMRLSFRSTDDILNAVDSIFADSKKAALLNDENYIISHEGIRSGVPGYVELWHSIGTKSENSPIEWYESADHVKNSGVELAQRVASTISYWLEANETIGAEKRPLQPGDILVLVRKRDFFIHALSRNLKEKNIPVSGVDRLKLASHIAVHDLIALGRCLLNFEDDFSLACVLKSPLFGIEEEQLLALCSQRGEKDSLLDSLRVFAQQSNIIDNILRQLEQWAEEAISYPPFEFYSFVLERDSGRKKMMDRLGLEIEEVLDEFLDYCLSQERFGRIGLEALLSSLETEGLEIKREMENTRNEVRIMTVHAAKGLEAPVVFLVDGGGSSFSDSHLPDLIPFYKEGNFKDICLYLWRKGEKTKNSLLMQSIEKLEEEAQKEYRRLLYVGMTRAEDRLIVCGYHNKREPDEQSWYTIVRFALENSTLTKILKHPIWGDDVMRFQSTIETTINRSESVQKAENSSIQTLPPLPNFVPLKEENVVEFLYPSTISSKTTLEKKDVKKDDALEYMHPSGGILVHKMLEILPNIDLCARKNVALGLMKHAGLEEDSPEALEIWNSVFDILANKNISFLFGKHSFAEVRVAGKVLFKGKETFISGRVDRVIQEEKRIWIIDYKTIKPSPSFAEEIPKMFLQQIALYRKLFQKMYPAKEIKTAILFTDTAKLIEIPAIIYKKFCF